MENHTLSIFQDKLNATSKLCRINNFGYNFTKVCVSLEARL